MTLLFDKFRIFFNACRGYSIPISFMSWLVPFLYAAFNNGNISFGLLSLTGIVILHLGTNIFDDAVDYSKEKFDIERGIKTEFNFQKGKCICIFENLISLKQAYFISFGLFLSAFLIGMYFIYISGFKLLYIIIPAALICVLYPFLGCLGLGEILVAVIFSPLIYSGVYFIMTGVFSSNILILSISTGLLSVAVLHNHMLLDYKYDTSNRKITLCRLCGSEKNALILLIIIISSAYINLIIWFFLGKLNYLYLLPLATIFQAVDLIKVIYTHIKSPNKLIDINIFNKFFLKQLNKVPENQRNFMYKFILAENLLSSFTIILCVSIVISNYIINN